MRLTDDQIEIFTPILSMASAILNGEFDDVVSSLQRLKEVFADIPKQPKTGYDQALEGLRASMSCDVDYHPFINRYLLADPFMISNFMDEFIDAAFYNQSYKLLDDILDIETVTVERLNLPNRYRQICVPVRMKTEDTPKDRTFIPPGYYSYPILMVLLERRITRDFLIERIYDIFDYMQEYLTDPQMRDLKFECNKYILHETIKGLGL